MWKIYFKQTIALLQQNKIISIVSIVGTALAIMMVMVLLLVEYINVKEMAPEINRDSMLYIKYMAEVDTTKQLSSRNLISSKLFNNYLKDIQPTKTISITTNYSEPMRISIDGNTQTYRGLRRSTDANYWKIMAFDFIAGGPYTQADCDAQLNKVVIAESKANEIFGNPKEAMNKAININFESFEIIGVVKDVSPIFTFCNASLFTSDIYKLHGYTVLLLTNSPKDFDKITEEVREIERKYGIDNPNTILTIFGPYDHKYQKYNSSFAVVDESIIDRKLCFILLVLLIIPAVNLSSFSYSQIKKRIEEIGIRKSFGATRWNIIKQVLIENFMTTLIGGFIGLLLSYATLFWLRNWLLELPEGGTIPPQALLSPTVFLMVFVICFIMNILSAGFPAIATLRMTIVDALNRK